MRSNNATLAFNEKSGHAVIRGKAEMTTLGRSRFKQADGWRFIELPVDYGRLTEVEAIRCFLDAVASCGRPNYPSGGGEYRLYRDLDGDETVWVADSMRFGSEKVWSVLACQPLTVHLPHIEFECDDPRKALCILREKFDAAFVNN